jgi:glycosyltransferase involved in cell wall biosynthesis
MKRRTGELYVERLVEIPEGGRKGDGPRGKLLVISHPSVVSVNQEIYRSLLHGGWDVSIIVPNRWRHEFSEGDFEPTTLPGLEGRVRTLPVGFAGRPQRHFYRTRPSRWLAELEPDVVFVEAESFSLAAAQWAFASIRAGIPFGVQGAENLDRPLPLPAKMLRRWTLRHARFVAARSPTAAELARKWGAEGQIELVPHAVPAWAPVSKENKPARFTVGYAGRLVTEKGIPDLLKAVELLEGPVELLVFGDGPLRTEVEAASSHDTAVRVVRDVSHERMPEAYAQMDVLVLPSRTTPRWREQFGRVLVEALWAGVPVVGSDSGEIPWVIETTGGGRVFPEGDAFALASVLEDLRTKPELRETLAARGRIATERLFSLDAAAGAFDHVLRAAIAQPEWRDEASGPKRRIVALIAHEIHADGGMERAFFELIRRGRDHFDFVVLSNRLSPELQPFVRWKRIRVLRRPIPLKFVMFYLFAALKLSRETTDLTHTMGALVPADADIASVHFCHAGYAEATARRPSARPFLRKVNSMVSRRLGLWAERRSYRPGRVRVLAAVSTGIRQELTRHYPGLPVELTPNGIDISRFHPDQRVRELVRQVEHVSETDVVALFVGGDWDHKGLAIAMRGLARARNGGAEGLHLWVVGDGDERRFRRLADDLRLSDRVRFLGFRRDVNRLYQAADIFVLPTLYESFSLAAFEAAASGLPLVVTRVHGVSELVGEKGEAGCLVDREPEAVGDALFRLATNPELRREKGSKGFQRARQRSWDEAVGAVLEIYGRLLNDRRGINRKAA